MKRAWIMIGLAACSSHPSGAAVDAPPVVDGIVSGDVYVDPALGTDDLQHGGSPGAGAWKTVTFALAHAHAAIHLDDGTYDHASGETFPLALSGMQELVGGASLGAHIVGDSNSATITIGGVANQLVDVDVSTTSTGAGSFADCVSFTSSGAHVVSGSNLHGCFAPLMFGGMGGVTISHVTTGDVTAGATAGNCLNQVGDHVHLLSYSCKASNDWVFGCGVDFTGCDTPVLGRQAACSADTSHFADPCM
jgi:hypothetical protein